MFLPAVEVLECGGQRLNHQFIARIEMFVETADSNTGLLHHIGNADAFQPEFAKPLGSNAHDPSVRLRLVTLRITHLLSPSLPESAWMLQAGSSPRVSAYSSLIGCKPPHPWCKKAHCINNKYNRAFEQMKRQRNVPKRFHKILLQLMDYDHTLL